MNEENVCFSIGNLNGIRGAAHIMQDLNALPGVLSVRVSVRRGSVAVDYDAAGIRREQIQGALSALGYEARPTLFF